MKRLLKKMDLFDSSALEHCTVTVNDRHGREFSKYYLNPTWNHDGLQDGMYLVRICVSHQHGRAAPLRDLLKWTAQALSGSKATGAFVSVTHSVHDLFVRCYVILRLRTGDPEREDVVKLCGLPEQAYMYEATPLPSGTRKTIDKLVMEIQGEAAQ